MTTRTKAEALRRLTRKRSRLNGAQGEYDAALVEAREAGASWRELEAARRGVPLDEIPRNASTATVRGVYHRVKRETGEGYE